MRVGSSMLVILTLSRISTLARAVALASVQQQVSSIESRHQSPHSSLLRDATEKRGDLPPAVFTKRPSKNLRGEDLLRHNHPFEESALVKRAPGKDKKDKKDKEDKKGGGAVGGFTFSDHDRDYIRGKAGAERGFFSQMGTAASLGAAYGVGNAVANGICGTAHIWAPALGRCVLQVAKCVGEACNQIAYGAAGVTAAITGKAPSTSGREDAFIDGSPHAYNTASSSRLQVKQEQQQEKEILHDRSSRPLTPAVRFRQHQRIQRLPSIPDQKIHRQIKVDYIRARQDLSRAKRKVARRRAAFLLSKMKGSEGKPPSQISSAPASKENIKEEKRPLVAADELPPKPKRQKVVGKRVSAPGVGRTLSLPH